MTYLDVMKKVSKTGIRTDRNIGERLVKSIMKRDTEGLIRTIAREGGGDYSINGRDGWIFGPNGYEILPDITLVGLEDKHENPAA